MVQIASILTFAVIPLLVAASPVAQPAPPKAPASAPAQKPATKAPTTNAPSGAKGDTPAKGGAPAKGGEASGKALPPVKGPVHPNAQAILSSLRTMKKGQFTPHLGGGGGKGKTAAPSKGSNNKSAAKAPAPKHLKGLPQGTHMLAYDHVKGQIHAYGKGMKLIGSIAAPKGAKAPAGASKGGSPAPKQSSAASPAKAPARMTKQKRDGGCSVLSSDDVQKLPGWAKLKQEAENSWGTGSYNVVTNDKDFPDRPATLCADTTTQMIKTNPNPQCQTNEIQVSGSLSNGSVGISQSMGTEYSNEMTVTKESSIATGVSVEASVGIEDIVDVKSTVNFQTTFTNTLAKSSSSKATNQVNINLNQNTNGQSCLWLKTSNCQITGTGSVRMIASGFVWFEYNDKTHDHYKWALSIDSTLSNLDDRSTFIDFSSAISSKTNAQYTDKCK